MEFLNKALDVIERAELDAGGDLDCLVNDDEEDRSRGDGCNKFQNENVHNRLLPYDVIPESQKHLMRIKTSLAKSILLDQESVYEWFIDLDR